MTSSHFEVHCFGHLHEQRGQWCRNSHPCAAATLQRVAFPGESFSTAVDAETGAGAGGDVGAAYAGGVEYLGGFATSGPPPPDYPCQLISCNAMKNHPRMEGKEPHLSGPARLIVATRKRSPGDGGGGGGSAGAWSFTARPLA